MRRDNSLAPAAVALVLMLGLSLLFYLAFGSFLRRSVLEPLSRGLFVAGWYMGRISQVVLWDIFVGLAAFLLLRAALGRRPGPRRRPRSRAAEERESELDHLRQAVRLARRQPLFRAALRRELAGVARNPALQGARTAGRERLLEPEEATPQEQADLSRFLAERDPDGGPSHDPQFLARLDRALACLEKHP